MLSFAYFVGGTVVCELAEPCGVIEDIVLLLLLGGLTIENIHMAKGSPQNILPNWVTARPMRGESVDEFATRVCTARYGSGPGSDFNKIKKWAQEWINKHG